MRQSFALRRIAWIAASGGLTLIAIAYAPETLAFPYHAQLPGLSVWAERPIDRAALARVTARADGLVASSPLATPLPPRRLFLTRGGWRWTLLTRGSGAFALSYPLSNAVVFNRADIAADRIANRAPVGGIRTLSGVMAHETAHILVARRIGAVAAALLPSWKAEGLSDVVARESSLSPAQAARLRSFPQPSPALFYYDARARVAALLAHGESVDTLLGGA